MLLNFGLVAFVSVSKNISQAQKITHLPIVALIFKQVCSSSLQPLPSFIINLTPTFGKIPQCLPCRSSNEIVLGDCFENIRVLFLDCFKGRLFQIMLDGLGGI